MNIAEGSTGQTNAEFNQFLGYSLRSAIEVVTCLHIGSKRENITAGDFEVFYRRTEEIIK